MFHLISGTGVILDSYSYNDCSGPLSYEETGTTVSCNLASVGSTSFYVYSSCRTAANPTTFTATCATTLAVPPGYATTSNVAYATNNYFSDTACTTSNTVFATALKTSTCVPSDTPTYGAYMKYYSGQPSGTYTQNLAPYIIRGVYFADSACTQASRYMTSPAFVFTSCAPYYMGSVSSALGTYSSTAPTFPTTGATARYFYQPTMIMKNCVTIKAINEYN